MSCGCNKANKYTQQTPAMLGDPNGAPARRFRSTVALMSMGSGAKFWATGTGVDAMVHAQWIVPID